MNVKNLKICAGVGLAAILVGGGAYLYSSTDKDKPEYAVKIAEQSVADHDRENFYRFVDVDGLLNDSYGSLIDGLTDSERVLNDDTKDALKNFTEILKTPLLTSLKAAVDSYVTTGDFNAQNHAGVQELLTRTGLDKILYRGLDGIDINPANANNATARIRIYQPELSREFILEAELSRGENGEWKIVRLKNFQDFVNTLTEVRRSQLDNYLEKAGEIAGRHDASILEAEQQYSKLAAFGALNQDSVRAEVRTLMLDVYKKDWEERKQELFGLSVPKSAETLQNLFLKICDLEINYADDYAKWLEDKRPSTLKIAEDHQRQSQALKSEVTILLRRMAGGERPDEN